jgi:hypothetical protein
MMAADTQTFALGMAAAAFLVGLAIDWNHGFYNPWALLLASMAALTGLLVCVRPRVAAIDALTSGARTAIVTAAIAVEAFLLWYNVRGTGLVAFGAIALGVLAVAQAVDLRGQRLLLLAVTLGVFFVVASAAFRMSPPPTIDVLMFQQVGASGLLHGENPYTPRYPNLYPADTAFYGAGVVDATNHLTVGYPYPPLSLLLALPAYIFGGDCRYADAAAIALSAGLMFLARPSQWTGLVAALFLLTPRSTYVVEYAWTEALFAFSLSVLMCCAIRWRRALPYALGVFMATKQYSLFALPFVPLLFTASEKPSTAVRVCAIAAMVAAVVTLPFFLWDPAAFWRSVVVFQFLQPLRTDALSHLVWINKYFPRLPWQQAIPFVALAATAAIAWWYRRPTPAYFAGAFAVVQLVFFAISKQAFANYYFFVIATLSWAAAAASWPGEEAPV